MDALKKILAAMSNHCTKEQMIAEFGEVHTIIGRIVILNSIIDEIEGIRLVMNDNLQILKVDFQLSLMLSFKELQEKIALNFLRGYNHYDEETVVNFFISNEITLRAFKKGYFDDLKIVTETFNQFEIQLNERTW